MRNSNFFAIIESLNNDEITRIIYLLFLDIVVCIKKQESGIIVMVNKFRYP